MFIFMFCALSALLWVDMCLVAIIIIIIIIINHACASLKTQCVIWICVQVPTDWVHSLFRMALIFEADEETL